MGFDQLLGNRQLKENLLSGIRRGSISHFYLISGPEGSGKKTLARLMAAAILCRNENKPCLTCSACRKVMADTHPDVITVTDPDHKAVSVDIIRQIRDDVFIRPNEAEKKIYLFPQELRVEGQSALLKVLEEPPAYGVFLMLTNNPENLLTPVRSRATPLQLQALSADILGQALRKDFPGSSPADLDAAIWRSGGFYGQAKTLLESGSALDAETAEFVNCFAAGDTLGLLQILAPLERQKREVFIDTVNQWIRILQQALICRNGQPAVSEAARLLATRRSPQDLNRAVKQLKTAVIYALGNISVAAICGHLLWSLR